MPDPIFVHFCLKEVRASFKATAIHVVRKGESWKGF